MATAYVSLLILSLLTLSLTQSALFNMVIVNDNMVEQT